MCLTIEVDVAAIELLLVDAGCLDGMTEATRNALAHGVEELLRLLYAARDAMPFENVVH